MGKKIALLPLLLLSSLIMHAQKLLVTGKGSDKMGAAIAGVNVSLAGQPSGTSTNAEGHYSIEVNSGTDSLVFTHTSFTRTVMAVGAKTVIDVVMTGKNTVLDQVVVVGYGTQKR